MLIVCFSAARIIVDSDLHTGGSEQERQGKGEREREEQVHECLVELSASRRSLTFDVQVNLVAGHAALQIGRTAKVLAM